MRRGYFCTFVFSSPFVCRLPRASEAASTENKRAIYSVGMEQGRKHARTSASAVALGTAPPSPLVASSWRRRWLGAALRCYHALAPRAATRAAYRLWTRPRRTPLRADERAWLARAERLPFVWDGRRVAVYAWGTGETVLLLHGWHGCAAHWRAFVEPLLAAGLRVVAWDAPAHGASGGRRTTLPELTAAACALTSQLGPLRGIVAHSLGAACGILALREAACAPRMVAISAPARFQTLLDYFTQPLALPEAFVQRLRALVETRYGAQAWEALSPETAARDLAVPGLLIHDRDDRLLAPAHARALARAWPAARLVQTKGLGHQRILADPQVVQLTVDFLRQ